MIFHQHLQNTSLHVGIQYIEHLIVQSFVKLSHGDEITTTIEQECGKYLDMYNEQSWLIYIYKMFVCVYKSREI